MRRHVSRVSLGGHSILILSGCSAGPFSTPYSPSSCSSLQRQYPTLTQVSIPLPLSPIPCLIPYIIIGSDWFESLFKRGDTYDTTYFPLSNLIYYIVMNVSGYVFVNISNMNYSRRSLLHSNHERRRDFFMTVAMCPIWFFLGNNINLRSINDLDSQGIEYTFWDCIAYNSGLWTLAYILGLQFTHLDGGVFRGFSLSPEHMKHWKP